MRYEVMSSSTVADSKYDHARERLTVTFVTVRAFYPRFVDLDRPDPEARPALARLERRLWLGLGVTVAVPFLAVILLALSGTWVTGAFLAMGAVGALCLLVVWLLVQIRKDLEALSGLEASLSVAPGAGDG